MHPPRLVDLSTNNSQLIDENIFEWNIALVMTNPDSLYNGGYLKAKMTFPKDYPFNPPGMKDQAYIGQWFMAHDSCRFQVLEATLAPQHLP